MSKFFVVFRVLALAFFWISLFSFTIFLVDPSETFITRTIAAVPVILFFLMYEDLKDL